MKSLFLVFLFVSSGAFARSMDVTPVLATVEGYEAGISQVALLNDGRLILSLENGDKETLRVSEANLEKMKRMVSGLYQTEVKKTVREFICMTFVMPTPQLADLRVSTTLLFGGEMRLVLTEQGCYLKTVVLPVHPVSLRKAELLRDKMVTLALEATR